MTNEPIDEIEDFIKRRDRVIKNLISHSEYHERKLKAYKLAYNIAIIATSDTTEFLIAEELSA